MNVNDIAGQAVWLIREYVTNGGLSIPEFLEHAKAALEIVEKMAVTVPLIKTTLDLFKSKPKVFEGSMSELLAEELENDEISRSQLEALLTNKTTNGVSVSTTIRDSIGVAQSFSGGSAHVEISDSTFFRQNPSEPPRGESE